MVTVLPPI